jgi:hypothetical protein
MSVCVYPAFVLFCVQVAALRQADPPPPTSKESYRMRIGLRTRKSGQDPTKGCTATDSVLLKLMNYVFNRNITRHTV